VSLVPEYNRLPTLNGMMGYQRSVSNDITRTYGTSQDRYRVEDPLFRRKGVLSGGTTTWPSPRHLSALLRTSARMPPKVSFLSLSTDSLPYCSLPFRPGGSRVWLRFSLFSPMPPGRTYKVLRRPGAETHAWLSWRVTGRGPCRKKSPPPSPARGAVA
jgi:hypothetical protein